jgi:predicted DNA binding protein
MYPKYELKNVTIKMVHENCWTSMIDNCIIKSIGRITIPEKSQIRAFMAMRQKDLKKVLKLRQIGKIKDIINISYNKGEYVVDMLINYNNSTLELLNNYDSIVLHMMNLNGREIWNFIIYEYSIPRLIKDLRSHGKVEEIIINDFSHEEPDLSREEFKVLLTAFNHGYFEYPRRCKVKEVAKRLGIRSSTFIYHIRNAERKIIREYLIKNYKKEES